MASKKDKDVRSEKMAALVETLSKPFDATQVQEKPISGGKKVKYVKSQWYIARLNEAFGVSWSLEICSHWMATNQLIMHVRIHYPNPDDISSREFKDGIAGHPFSGDVGNAFKAVYSKAFTIAASKIGVGLQLWGVETSIDEVDESPSWEDQYQGPPVTVVNPGAHNPLPVPPTPPIPSTSPVTPPPPPPPGQREVQVPTFFNQSVAAPPPVPAAMDGQLFPPPPVPTGNPFPNGGQNIGFSNNLPNGGVTAATTSIGISSVGTNNGNRIVEFQINGIIGAAVSRGMSANPMQLVAQVLGPQFLNMPIEQLTMEQAQQVMDAVRDLPLQ